MKANLLLFCVVAFLAGPALSAEPKYTPSEIDELIKAGSAKGGGGQFANGLETSIYLWKESANHHVFFFRRNAVAYGEFRDERLADGRFISIFEKYLVVDSRKSEVLSKAKELRFVCKKTRYVWMNKVWVSSQVHWWFLTTDLSGNALRQDEPVEKRMIRGVVSVVVPDHLTPNARWGGSDSAFGRKDIEVLDHPTPDGETYFLGLRRKSLTPYEIAFGYGEDAEPVFGRRHPVFEHFGFTNGRCSIWAEWPEDDPEFVVVLSQKLPNPPGDATPFAVRTKEIATMSIKLHPPRNTPFVFIPD